MTRTYYRTGRGLAIVPVVIRGPRGTRRLNAVVDTGAIRTLVSQAQLASIGLDEDSSVGRMPFVSVTGHGSAPLISVDSVAAMGIERPGLIVVGYDMPRNLGAQCLLGMDFIRGYRVCFDTDSGAIDVEEAGPLG